MWLKFINFVCLFREPDFAPAPDTFFQGLVGGKRTSTRRGKRKKKKCKQIKNRRKRKEKKAKKTWGLVSYPLTPPPPKTQSNVKLPRFGCFWVFCGLPVFFSETDPSEALGGLQERLLPSSPGRLAPAGEAAGSPRALPSAPLAPRARGELG